MDPGTIALATMAVLGALQGKASGDQKRKIEREKLRAENERRRLFAPYAPYFDKIPQAQMTNRVADYGRAGMLSGAMSGLGIGAQLANYLGSSGKTDAAAPLDVLGSEYTDDQIQDLYMPRPRNQGMSTGSGYSSSPWG